MHEDDKNTIAVRRSDLIHVLEILLLSFAGDSWPTDKIHSQCRRTSLLKPNNPAGDSIDQVR